MLPPSPLVTGLRPVSSSLAEDGIGLYASGRRVSGHNQKYITQNACNGTSDVINSLNTRVDILCSVTSTLFTADARFVLSGSDDGNVRMWKARASEKLGVIDARERAAIEYRDSLKERWRFDPEVNKISRYVPILYCSNILIYTCDVKHPSRAEARIQGCSTQAHYAGSTPGQGGAQTQAHSRRRQQAKGRAQKGGHCRADIGNLFLVHGAFGDVAGRLFEFSAACYLGFSPEC